MAPLLHPEDELGYRRESLAANAENIEVITDKAMIDAAREAIQQSWANAPQAKVAAEPIECPKIQGGGGSQAKFPNSPDSPTPSRYQWSYKGVNFDFYRLCEIIGIQHHAQAHALKKIIRRGGSIKCIEQDIDEAIAAMLRWREMVSEDKSS